MHHRPRGPLVQLTFTLMVASLLSTSSIPPSLASASEPGTPSANDEQYRTQAKELMRVADEHQASGAHADAARGYAKAYDALAQRSRSDSKELQAVSLAVDEFKLAQVEKPDDIQLLEDEAALLRRYQQRKGSLPEDLAKELERLDASLEELRQLDPTPTTTDPGGEAEEPRPDEPSTPEQPDEAREPYPEPTDDDEPVPRMEAPAGRKPGTVVLASGVVGLVGSAALLGYGLWMFSAAKQRYSDQETALDANEYPDESGIRERLDEWHQRGNTIATGLVVGGAVLAGVGVGLTIWGSKLRKRGAGSASRRASLTPPMVFGRGFGIAATVTF